MSLSARVLRRIEAIRDFEAFLAHHADTLGDDLEKKLEPELRSGEAMPDFALALRLFERHLHRRRQSLGLADRRLADAEASLDARRRERNAVADRLRELFVSLRDTVSGLFGDPGLTLTGLGGQAPRQPFELWATCRELLGRATRLDLSKLPARVGDTGFEARRIAETLAPETEELGALLEAVEQKRRQLEWLRKVKSDLTKALETSYVSLGGLTQSICRFTRRPELVKYTHRPLRRLDRRRKRSVTSSQGVAVENNAP